MENSLDCHNNKQAFSLCNKLLKKSPGTPLALAFKALACGRLGKYSECLAIIEALLPEANLLSETVLLYISLACKSIDEYELVPKFYEKAWSANVRNLEMGINYYLSLVKIFDYKSQQQVALKLAKTFADSKYINWACVSAYSQSKDKSSISLQLAHRLMSKQEAEGKITSIEELLLYVKILNSMGLYEKSMSVIKSFEFPSYFDKVWELLKVLKLKSNTLELIEFCLLELEQAKKSLDNWSLYECILDGLSWMDENDSENQLSFLERAENIVIHNSSNVKLRSPHLFRVALSLHRKKDSNNAVLNYLNLYASKSCCFVDLFPWLSKLDLGQSASLLESLKDKYFNVGLTDASIEVVEGSKLALFLGAYNAGKGLEEIENTAKEMTKHLETHEDFALISALLLVQAAFDYKNESLLFDAIEILEKSMTLKNQKDSSIGIKLLCLRVNAIVGNFDRSIQIFKSMEIKNIQLESSLHFIADYLLFLPNHYPYYSRSLWNLYQSNGKDTLDMIANATMKGSYSKVLEFEEFYWHLENSLQRQCMALLDCQVMLANYKKDDFFRQCEEQEILETIVLEAEKLAKDTICHDNRDKQVFMLPVNESTTLFLSREDYYYCGDRIKFFLGLFSLLKYSTEPLETIQEKMRNFLTTCSTSTTSATSTTTTTATDARNTANNFIIAKMPWSSLVSKIFEVFLDPMTTDEAITAESLNKLSIGIEDDKDNFSLGDFTFLGKISFLSDFISVFQAIDILIFCFEGRWKKNACNSVKKFIDAQKVNLNKAIRNLKIANSNKTERQRILDRLKMV